MALFGQNVRSAHAGFLDKASNFAFDLLLSLRGQAVIVGGKINISEFLGVPKPGYQSESRLCGLLDILQMISK